MGSNQVNSIDFTKCYNHMLWNFSVLKKQVKCDEW